MLLHHQRPPRAYKGYNLSSTTVMRVYLVLLASVAIFDAETTSEGYLPKSNKPEIISGNLIDHLKKHNNLLRADRWWPDQSPVDWSVQCHYPATPQTDSSTSFCVRTLQINCRPSSVRAVYQNVVFKSPVEQISLSVRASGEQLDPAATASFMGVY